MNDRERTRRAPPAVEDAQKVIDDLHPEDRTAAGRARFSCRAARHLPSAERRARFARQHHALLEEVEFDLKIAASRATPPVEEISVLFGTQFSPALVLEFLR
jgi:hypothetical protein